MRRSACVHYQGTLKPELSVPNLCIPIHVSGDRKIRFNILEAQNENVSKSPCWYHSLRNDGDDTYACGAC
tara:strand:- start:29 stop:238 length:210 start_codon:yes stop_codon:yes gene_type:complete